MSLSYFFTHWISVVYEGSPFLIGLFYGSINTSKLYTVYLQILISCYICTITTTIKIQKIIIISKRILITPVNFTLPIATLSLLEFQINGIIQYAFICVWLLSLRIMLLSFIHVVTCHQQFIFLIAECYSDYEQTIVCLFL